MDDTPIIVTIVGMVLASLAALGTAILSYLAGRDKLRYDAKLVQLETDNRRLLAERQQLQDRIEILRGQHQ